MRHAVWILLMMPLYCIAQAPISGLVLEQHTAEPLSYVIIGTIPEGIVKRSRTDGSFQLKPSDGAVPDSVRFALAGYAPLTLSWAQLLATDTVWLQPVSYPLADLEVVGGARIERRLGNRSHHMLFNYALAERTAEEVIEVAQVIELGPQPVLLRSVNFYISATPMDSATLRIGFRSYDGERPTGSMLARSLVRRVSLQHGWLSMDIAAENIRLKGAMALTLEVLPEPDAERRYMEVGIRLGGGEPAFDRRGAFEQWAQMPHRYSINVTAMVPKDTPDAPAEDPDPFQHAVDLRIASTVVRDTFAIAFGLPEKYDPSAAVKYPTVYVLDANVYFNDVLDLCRHEARKGRMPPVLVVGVGYRDIGAADTLRERDYTLAPSDSMPRSGGAGHFLSFLQRELIPVVNARFRTDSARCVLIGHSLGGQLVLAALVDHELHGELPFNTFIVASPSVDLADGALLRALDGLASEAPTRVRNVFIGHGEGEDDASLRKAIALLKASSVRGVVERHYAGTDHMGTALPSFRDGLRLLLVEEGR